jgi:hypothetical protein
MILSRVTKQRAAIVAAAVVMATGSLSLAPGAANAANLDGSCQASEVCLYQNQFYGGGLADFVGNDSDYSNNNFVNSGTGLNDRVSSVKNRDSNCDVRLYPAANYGGSWVLFESGEDYFYVSLLINDKASSHKWDCS